MLVLTDGLAECNSKHNYDGAHGGIDWLSATVLHPLVNAALIDPVNTVSRAVADVSGKRLSLPEMDALSVNRSAETYSPSWYVQSAMSGLGSLVPFVISGKLTAVALRGGVGTLGLEARTEALLESDHVAQLSGAGIYAAMKRPDANESRLGNAVGTVAAFCVFDIGNSTADASALKKASGLSLLTSSALRLGTGFAGGALQVQAASLVSNQRFASSSKTLESAASGSFLNLGLGAESPMSAGFQPARSDTHVELQQRAAVQLSKAHLTEPHPFDALESLAPLSETRGIYSSVKTSEPPLNLSQFADSSMVAKLPKIEGGNVVYIVIDSGFWCDSLPPQENILGAWDPTGKGIFNDPLNHGSEVLNRLKTADPNAKFMLIRAYDGDGNQASTKFEQGKISQPGWTEAYLEAVALADKLNLPSVANCSFGEFSHAMDGTGWQSFQLSKAIGDGKPGHIVVAASGPGDGAPRHASGAVESAGADVVNISQNGEAAFNLWMGKDAPKDWNLSVYQGDRQVYQVDGTNIEPNFWNDRQQITFRSQSDGEPTRFELSRLGNDPRPLAFDFWVQEGKTAFLDHLNKTLISEPAVFPDVVAVGLKDGTYAPDQEILGHKPNVLVPGDGPVSFRTPEVTLAIGKMLKANPNLDAPQVQKLLGKFPLETKDGL